MSLQQLSSTCSNFSISSANQSNQTALFCLRFSLTALLPLYKGLTIPIYQVLSLSLSQPTHTFTHLHILFLHLHATLLSTPHLRLQTYHESKPDTTPLLSEAGTTLQGPSPHLTPQATPAHTRQEGPHLHLTRTTLLIYSESEDENKNK